MKDLGLNAGFVAWAEEKADDDALILKILWQAGCVFYVRTAEPQSLVRTYLCQMTRSSGRKIRATTIMLHSIKIVNADASRNIQ